MSAHPGRLAVDGVRVKVLLARAVLSCLLATSAVGLAVPSHAADQDPPAVAEGDLSDGPEGLRLADLRRGEGDPLQAGARVSAVIQLWSSPGAPPVRIGSPSEPLGVVVGGGSLIRGLDLGLVGMRRGGLRYLDIPAGLTSGAGTPMKAVIQVLSEAELAAGSQAAPQSAAPSSLGASAAARQPPAAPPDVESWEKLRNGLQYSDLLVGTGAEVQAGQTVVVEYTGWVVESGERFDSSLARAEPFRFTLGGGQVILGWDKGLRGMRIGGTRVLQIPAYLGYGAAGAGSIPPHADLVFKVELLGVE